jgi:hypothetical protein
MKSVNGMNARIIMFLADGDLLCLNHYGKIARCSVTKPVSSIGTGQDIVICKSWLEK